MATASAIRRTSRHRNTERCLEKLTHRRPLLRDQRSNSRTDFTISSRACVPTAAAVAATVWFASADLGSVFEQTHTEERNHPPRKYTARLPLSLPLHVSSPPLPPQPQPASSCGKKKQKKRKKRRNLGRRHCCLRATHDRTTAAGRLAVCLVHDWCTSQAKTACSAYLACIGERDFDRYVRGKQGWALSGQRIYVENNSRAGERREQIGRMQQAGPGRPNSPTVGELRKRKAVHA